MNAAEIEELADELLLLAETAGAGLRARRVAAGETVLDNPHAGQIDFRARMVAEITRAVDAASIPAPEPDILGGPA